MALLGLESVPVAAGIGQPLTAGKQVYWGGWEGKGFLTEQDNRLPLDPRDGVDLILEILRSAPEPVRST